MFYGVARNNMAFFPVIYLLVNCIFYVHGVQVPSSPCPDIFQYLNDKNGDYYGKITLPYTDGARYNISVGVAAWMPGYYPEIKTKHVEMRLITAYDDLIKNITTSIVYHIDFPFKNVIPLINIIGLNDKIYCNGPPVPPNDGTVEFTTCGQMHHIDFPLICRDSRPTNEQNNFVVSSHNKDVEKSNKTDLDSSITESSKPNSREQYLNFPLFKTDLDSSITKSSKPSSQEQYLKFPLSSTDNRQPDQIENPKQSDHTKYIDISPYTEKSKPISHQTKHLDIPPKIEGDNPSNQTQSLDFPPYDVDDQPYLKKDEKLQDYLGQGHKIARATDTFSSYNDICGRPTVQLAAISSRILYGQGVPKGAYPWLVAIFRTKDSFGLNYICSGSLVSNKHVITAAHCMMMDSRRIKPQEIACILGKLNIGTWGIGEEEKMLQPRSIDLHPAYKRGQANADIAVITFGDSLSFNQVIKPLCLWQDSNELAEFVGEMGTVVGWGKQENDVDTSEPKQVSMPIVDQFECVKGSKPSVEHALLEIVSKNTFCAGFRNGSGPCMGDSGSAFLLKRDEVFYLRGIVSTAVSDETVTSCNLKEYVVFTDASKHLEWLMDILK